MIKILLIIVFDLVSFDSILSYPPTFVVFHEEIALMEKNAFHQYSTLLKKYQITFDKVSSMIDTRLDIEAFNQLIFILLFLTFIIFLELFPRAS